MGINVIFSGRMYHFDNDEAFDDLLDMAADSISETEKGNGILYDNELHLECGTSYNFYISGDKLDTVIGLILRGILKNIDRGKQYE